MDLSFDQLQSRILTPYERGEPLVVNGRTITPEDIEQLRISRSDQPAGELISVIKREDSQSTVLFIGGSSYEWRAADRAEDITDEKVLGPPGYRRTEGEESVSSRSEDGHSNKRVFVVHGHDLALKSDVEVFLTRIGLEPVVLHRQPDEGLTIMEKLEKHADVGFALVLFTPDDVAFPASEVDEPEEKRSLEFRARQNVILEFGYFAGLLGRSRVCCIYKENVSIPSDIQGLLYKEVSESIEEVAWELIQEMKAACLEVHI